MQVLKERKSSREFGSKQLPLQTLSNLLWAGFGVNRPETGQRTAPSASNRQEISLYVADFSKMRDLPEESRMLYAAADTGFIGQNIYLYCASEGLATVVRGMIDRPALEKTERRSRSPGLIIFEYG